MYPCVETLRHYFSAKWQTFTNFKDQLDDRQKLRKLFLSEQILAPWSDSEQTNSKNTISYLDKPHDESENVPHENLDDAQPRSPPLLRPISCPHEPKHAPSSLKAISTDSAKQQS